MNILVGCSSKNNIDKKYFNESKILLDELLKGNNLVFGADDTGLMGLSHEIAVKHNSNIIGVCQDKYSHDFNRLKCTNEIVVKNTSKRIHKLLDKSDVYLFLPGGTGTMSEFFMALESKRAKEFDRPIILYNIDNYFDSLINMIELMVKDKFSDISIRELFFVANTKEEVLSYISNYEVKYLKKEISCGTFIFKDNKVLLLKLKDGHYSLPKGHQESGETNEETALRETKEECNLDVKLIPGRVYIMTYNSRIDIKKELVVFLAMPLNDDIKIQEEEVTEAVYVPFDKISNYLTHKDSLDFCLKLINEVRRYNENNNL